MTRMIDETIVFLRRGTMIERTGHRMRDFLFFARTTYCHVEGNQSNVVRCQSATGSERLDGIHARDKTSPDLDGKEDLEEKERERNEQTLAKKEAHCSLEREGHQWDSVFSAN